jgi:DnaJ-class molecular chaperone
VSEYITKSELKAEIEGRMSRHRDKGEVSSAHKIAELRSLMKWIAATCKADKPCTDCNGSGVTPMGAMPWETGGDACSYCDGHGKRKAVFYG